MKLTELQVILGNRIKLAVDLSIPEEDRKKEADISMTVASLAKQMINNADVVLRTEKLVADGKLVNSKIKGML